MKKKNIIQVGLALILCLLFAQAYAETGNLLTLVDFRRDCENQSVLINHPFYPDSLWNRWINEGSADIASYCIIEKLDTIQWVVGTMNYDLNNDFIALIALFPLKPFGKKTLNFIPAKDIGKLQELNPTEEPKDFWQSGKGRNATVGFYPPPVVIDTMLIIYGAEAEYMDSDADTTDIPYSYRPLIIDYVVWRALLRDGKRNTAVQYWGSYKERLEANLKFEQKRFDVLILPEEIKK